MSDITPFVYNRMINLAICFLIVAIIAALMHRHRRKAFYLFPPLFWVLHGSVFYSYWLISYFGYLGLSFHLQMLNDWGSVFVAHGLWSLLIILGGLLFRFAQVIFLSLMVFFVSGGRGG